MPLNFFVSNFQFLVVILNTIIEKEKIRTTKNFSKVKYTNQFKFFTETMIFKQKLDSLSKLLPLKYDDKKNMIFPPNFYMLFNSIDFALFLPIVFILYWFVFKNKLKAQNFLVVIASYVFYGWWDWRFLSLIVFSTLVDYLVGLGLDKEEKQFNRKICCTFLGAGLPVTIVNDFREHGRSDNIKARKATSLNDF